MFFLITLFFFCSHNCFSQSLINNQSISFIQETIATEPVRTDPDDPAIWVHPSQPELSLLIGTDKTASIGGLYVFDLDGKIIQHIANIDRPNNVDVEYGFQINETYSFDLVVITEREQRRLRIFSINATTRRLYEFIGGNTNVFINSTGNQAAPMGIGLYKQVNDGKFYAIVSRKAGPNRGYLGQYELIWNGQSIDLKFIRYFGDFQGLEIESIVVDDQLGFVYYSDEHYGIRKYNIDPTTNQTEQIGFINSTNLWQGDSEGLALYTTSDKNGYLIGTDQIENGTKFHIFERQGNNSYVNSIITHADSTDGIEATSRPLNKNFPYGLLIVMNEIGKNFLVYDWRNIEKELDVVKNNVHYNELNFIYFILELCITICFCFFF
jgi:3-phytase